MCGAAGWAHARRLTAPRVAAAAIQSVFKNVFQIDPVRQKWSYRLTIGSLPITAGLFALASHLNQEVERHEGEPRRMLTIHSHTLARKPGRGRRGARKPGRGRLLCIDIAAAWL